MVAIQTAVFTSARKAKQISGARDSDKKQAFFLFVMPIVVSVRKQSRWKLAMIGAPWRREVSGAQVRQIDCAELQSLARMHCQHSDGVNPVGPRWRLPQLFFLAEYLQPPDICKKTPLRVFASPHKPRTHIIGELKYLIDRQALLLSDHSFFKEQGA